MKILEVEKRTYFYQYRYGWMTDDDNELIHTAAEQLLRPHNLKEKAIKEDKRMIPYNTRFRV